MKADGDEYKLRTGLIIDVIDDMPMIGIIQKIFVVDEHTIFFRVNVYECTYDEHYRAYILSDKTTSRMVSQCNLFCSGPVHIHTSHIHELYNSFVILPFALCTL